MNRRSAEEKEEAEERDRESEEEESYESEEDEDREERWDLDNIDWNVAASAMGGNVEVRPSRRQGEPPLLVKKLRAVRDDAALRAKLSDVQRSDKLPWRETLLLRTQSRTALRNVDNDLKREVAFYEATLQCVKEGLKKLDRNGIPYRRPNDFYAEMMKSDFHMQRVKKRILWEKKRIGVVEERKRNQRLRKFHKSQMAERKKQKNRESKELTYESVRDDQSGKTLQEILQESRKEYLARKASEQKKKPNMKRIMKNLKYGSGNRHLRSNRNTHASTNAIDADFRRSGNMRHLKMQAKRFDKQETRKRTRLQRAVAKYSSQNARGGPKGKGKGKGKGKKQQGKRPGKKQRWRQMVAGLKKQN